MKRIRNTRLQYQIEKVTDAERKTYHLSSNYVASLYLVNKVNKYWIGYFEQYKLTQMGLYKASDDISKFIGKRRDVDA